MTISAFSEEEVLSLSLDEAIEYAISNNPQLEANDVKIAKEKVSIDAEQANKRKAKATPLTFYTPVEISYVKNGYTLSAAEMGLRIALAQKEQTKNKIAYNVTQSYFNYKLSERLINVNENAQSLADENKKAVDRRFELGMAAKIEVLGAELALQRMKTNKNIAIRNLSIAKENFKIALNIENDTQIKLIDEIETKSFDILLEEDIKKAMETRFDVLALKEKKDLDGLYFDITAKITAENTANYKKAQSQFMDSKFSHYNGSKLIQLSLRGTYNTVLNSFDMMELAKLDYEIKVKEYEGAKIKYEIGMITNTELTDSLNKMLNSEVEYEKSKLAYKLALEKYNYEIKTGI
jgi:outer membrane protein TolC